MNKERLLELAGMITEDAEAAFREQAKVARDEIDTLVEMGEALGMSEADVWSGLDQGSF